MVHASRALSINSHGEDMQIIGLTGKAGCGKDTTADYLCKHYNFKKISFAQPIRDGLNAMFGVGYDQMQDRIQKESVINWIGKSPRQLMQTLGTEWARNHVANDIWLRVAAHNINLIQSDGGYAGIVISDVRFENEAEWVRQHGKLWFITRMESGLANGLETHASEQTLIRLEDEPTIANDGSFQDLYTKVESLFHVAGK